MADNPEALGEPLEYRKDKLHMRMLPLALGLIPLGAYMFFSDGSRNELPGIAVALVGLGWAGHLIVQLTTNPPATLTLSREGVVYREVSPALIPWNAIEGVDAVDHTMTVPGKLWDHTVRFAGVTALWLPRDFFDARLRSSLPFLQREDKDQRFVWQSNRVGIVIFEKPLSVTSEALRREIEARWKAFGGGQAAQAEEAAGSTTAVRFGRRGTLDLAAARRRRFASLAWVATMVAVGGLFYVTGWDIPSFREWRAARQQEQREREIEQTVEETRKRFEQVDREVQALREQHKRDSEAFWKEFDKQFEPPPPAAPQAARQEEQAAVRTDESPAANPEKLPLAGHSDSVVWLSISADGRQLLSASIDRTVKLWDLKTGAPVRDVGRHEDMARAALFLPDGQRVLSAGDDGLIATWSLAEGKLEHAFVAKEYGAARGLAISGDGRLAASTHQSGTVVVWDLEARKKRHVLAGHIWSTSGVAISADGGLVISGDIDGELRVWNTATGEMLRRWKGHERGVYAIAFLADGRRAVTASGDGLLKLWDIETGRELRSFAGHAATVYALAVSADGNRLLSGSLDGTARLWDLVTGAEIKRFDNPGGSVYAVALAADRSVITGDDGGRIRVWSASGGSVRNLLAAQ